MIPKASKIIQDIVNILSMETEAFAKELSRLKAALKRRAKSARKYREKAEKRLLECQGWAHEQHLAELLQAHLYLVTKGIHELVVADWEQEGKPVTLLLNPLLKPHEEVAARFKSAKKLKRGLPHAESQLLQAQAKEEEWTTILQEFEAIRTPDALEAFHGAYTLPQPQVKISPEKKPPPKPYWGYISSAGIPIWVGKNAKMNEQLTFHYAHGNDGWLHVTDYPGSHVVIHLSSKSTWDEETLKDACQLTLHYSKARLKGAAEVSLTHVKYVRRFGKEKGKVQIAKEKRLLVKRDEGRLSKLLHP